MLEVGRISRAHGLRGEVLVVLTTTELARLEPGSVLTAGDRELVVQSAQRHQRNWIVQFEALDSREAAEDLRGQTLWAEPMGDAGDDADAMWVHELIGAEVFDLAGNSHGRVDAVQDNPASDLLVLESGALVPLTFVVDWDVRGERLRIDPPPGLFDP